jgi:hypothetical protein
VKVQHEVTDGCAWSLFMLSIVSENLLSEYYVNNLAHKGLSSGQVVGYLRNRNLKWVVSLEVGLLADVVVTVRASSAVHTYSCQ